MVLRTLALSKPLARSECAESVTWLRTFSRILWIGVPCFITGESARAEDGLNIFRQFAIINSAALPECRDKRPCRRVAVHGTDAQAQDGAHEAHKHTHTHTSSQGGAHEQKANCWVVYLCL